MASYSVRTKLSPEVALERVIHTFGPEGLGLTLSQQTEAYVVLEGGGGHVAAVVRPTDDQRTEVDIETREWDYHVQRFIGKIG